MGTTTNTAVAEYVARIQAALADLPAAEIEEIVEDIRQHLSEVAGELGDEVSVEALTERLGTPEQYASELRAAAGYPPATGAPPARSGTFAARVALWGLVIGVLDAFLAGVMAGTMKVNRDFGPVLVFGLPLAIAIVLIFIGTAKVATVVTLPEYRAVAQLWARVLNGLPDQTAAYLRSLRPAWWLIRIVVLVVAILVALGNGTPATVVVLLAGTTLLLLFGKRARTDGRWRWIVGPANIFALGVGLALLGTVSKGVDHVYPVVYGPPDGLYNDRRPVENLYMFGPDGKPLPEVYLYDQDGRPISVLQQFCERNSVSSNKFPQPRIQYDSTGCHEVSGVPFTVVIPQSSTPSPSSPPPSSPSPPPSK